MTEQTYFARKSSGLVREFGTLDMVLIASAATASVLFTFLQFPWYYGFNPGADLNLGLVIAFFFYLLLSFVYWTIGVIMPRSGNDYVWVSRTFHPAIGFSWAMVFMVSSFSTGYVGGLSSWVYALGTALSMWGSLYNSQGLIGLANWVSSPWGGFLFVIVLTLVFAALTLVGSRAIKSFIYLTSILSLVAIIIMWGILGTTSPAAFAAKWDMVLGHYTTYDNIVTLASNAGWSLTPITLAATMTSMPFVVLFLLGNNVTTVMAGEIKGFRKAIPIALIASLILSVLLWMGCNTFTLGAVGAKWMYALGYLWDNAPNSYNGVLPIAPTLPLMVSLIVYPNQFMIFVIYVTMLVGSINAIFISFWLPSRYFFAWAFDRILPTKVADVNKRFRTPHIAIALITVLWILIAILYWFTSFSIALSISTLLYNLCFAIVALGCVIFPFTKKDLLAQAPAFLGKKIVGIPLISIIGALCSACFFWIGYISIMNPLIITPTTYGAIIAIGLIVGCLIIYYASLLYHKKRGLAIALVFKEIPPD